MSESNWKTRLASSLVGQNIATEGDLLAAQQTIRMLEAELQSGKDREAALKLQHEEALHFVLNEHQKGVNKLSQSQKQTETRLQQTLNELSTLKTRFNTHLGQQAVENERLLQQMNWLSGTIAHDLRTPIRAIDAYTFFLEDDLGALLTEDAKKSLSEVRRNGHRMSVLVEGLLEYMRISVAPVTPEPIDCGSFILPLLQAHDFTHACTLSGSSFTVSADKATFKKALEALLENAQKFSARAENPSISVLMNAEQRSLEIRDNGVGFNVEHSNKLFRLFHRLHGNDEFPGEGVGLCLAQRAIQRFGGELSLHRDGGLTLAKIFFGNHPHGD